MTAFESVDAETFAGVISDPDVLLQSDFTERIQTMDRSKTIAKAGKIALTSTLTEPNNTHVGMIRNVKAEVK